MTKRGSFVVCRLSQRGTWGRISGGVTTATNAMIVLALCAVTHIIRCMSRRYICTLLSTRTYTNPGSTDVCQAERRASRRREDRAYDILNSRLILERRFSAKSRHDVIRRHVYGTVVCEILISFLKTKG